MDIAVTAEAIAADRFGQGARVAFLNGAGRPFAVAVVPGGEHTGGKIVAVAAGDYKRAFGTLISMMLREDPNPTTPEVCEVLGITDAAVRHQMQKGRLTRLVTGNPATSGNASKVSTWEAESVGRRAMGMMIAREVMAEHDRRAGTPDAQRLHDEEVVAIAKAAGIYLVEDGGPEDRENLVGPGFGQEV